MNENLEMGEEEKAAGNSGRVAAAIDAARETARETYETVQAKAAQGASYMDKAIRNNPYQALLIALGVGAVLGCLLSRRSRD